MLKIFKIGLFSLVFFLFFCSGENVSAANLVVSQPVQITSHAKYERNQSVFKDDEGKIWIFYARADTCTGSHLAPCSVDGSERYMIYYQTSTDNGNTWSSPILLDKPRQNTAAFAQKDISAFKDSSGKLWVFASSGDTGTCRNMIYYTSTDDGASWADPLGVSLPGTVNDVNCTGLTGTRLGHSNVIYASNTIWLVYQASGGSAIKFSTTADGVTWSAIKDVYGTGHYIPKLALIDGILYLVTAQSSGQIWLATSTDSGETWSTKQIAGSNTAYVDWDPTIAKLSDGKLLVVWAPNTGSDGQQLKSTYSTDAGVTWSAAKDITAGTYNAAEWWDYWPSLLVDGSNTYLFYSSEQTASGTNIGGGDIWMHRLDWTLDNDHYGMIQQGVTHSNVSDVIDVAAGIYDESLTLNKSISLQGPNYAIDPNTGVRNSEAVINTHSGNINIGDAVSPSIKGFTITGTGGYAAYYYNTVAPSSISLDFQNNIVHDSYGFEVKGMVGGNITVNHNKFQNIIGSSKSAVNIFYWDHVIVGPQTPSGTVRVNENVIQTTTYSAIQLENIDDAQVIGNTIENTPQQALNIATSMRDATISSNTISSANTSHGSGRGGIRIYGTDFLGTVNITSNTIMNCWNGFAVRNTENISGKDIYVYGNSFVGNGNYAIYNGGTGTLDAAQNYFGVIAPVDVAAQIFGTVTYIPWYTDSARTTLVSSGKSILLYNFSSPSVVGIVSSTAHTIALLVPSNADITALIPTVEVSSGASVNPDTGLVQDYTNPVIYTVTAADGTTQTYTVTVTKTVADQTVPATDGTAIVNSTTPELILTSSTQAVEVTIADGTSNPAVNYSAFVSDGAGVIPQTSIYSEIADVFIPSSVLASSSDSAWNGVMEAPIVTTVTLPSTPGYTKTVEQAIEIGYSDSNLSFDKAIKMVFEGKAGKRIGHVRTGEAFVEITDACAGNSQAWADANLGEGGDCKVNAGNDLVVWTKHFTKFAVYSQAQIFSGGGGGGGSSIPAVSPTLGVVPVSVLGGNTVTKREISLIFDVNNAAVVAISENPDFSGAAWELFAASKNYTLSEGSGNKKLYLKFRSSSGGETKSQALDVNYTEEVTPSNNLIVVSTTENSPKNFAFNFRPGLTAVQEQGIINMVNSGRLFSERDARNYAWATEQNDWSQFVGINPKATAIATTTSHYYFTRFLNIGSVGVDVRALQQILKDLGYFIYPSTTGIYGPVTKSAVIEYQKAKGIAPYPGYVGPGTRAALNAE